METQFLKSNKTIRSAIAVAAGATALLTAGAAQAALHDRDLNGDSTANGPMSNTGNFQNLRWYDTSRAYWTGTEYPPPPPNLVVEFFTYNGQQILGDKGNPDYAMAVRNGDVAAVPEPQTAILVLAGLTALALARRQRPR